MLHMICNIFYFTYMMCQNIFRTQAKNSVIEHGMPRHGMNRDYQRVYRIEPRLLFHKSNRSFLTKTMSQTRI